MRFWCLWSAGSEEDQEAAASESEQSSQSEASKAESRSPSEADGALDPQKLKNQNRTFKARVAALLAKQKRKIELELKPQGCTNPEEEVTRCFQREFLASKATQWDPLEDVVDTTGHETWDETSGRRRAVYSYFKAFAGAVMSAFQWTDQCSSTTQATTVSHVISINTNDDTNMKLGSGTRGSTEVRSVMNNIQEHILLSESSEQPIWFSVHQPLVALERADASCLYSHFMAWLLGFAGYVGWKLRVWGIPVDLFRGVRRHTVCFIGDALRVNDCLFRYLSETVQHRPAGNDTQSHTLQIHCMIHQLNLTRRSIAVGFPNYWSNLVRLGHLYESHSFRQKFRVALAKLIRENFVYIRRVAEYPAEMSEWNKLRLEGLKLHNDSAHLGKISGSISTRMKGLRRITQLDNGCPNADLITHWCNGKCLPGDTCGEQECLSALIGAYCDHFSHMCVPLLYRWKHGASANAFVRD